MITWKNMFFEDDNTQFNFPFGEIFALKISGENEEDGMLCRVYPAKLIYMKAYSGGHLTHGGSLLCLYGKDHYFDNDCGIEYAMKVIKFQDSKMDLVTYIQQMGDRWQWCTWDEYMEAIG